MQIVKVGLLVSCFDLLAIHSWFFSNPRNVFGNIRTHRMFAQSGYISAQSIKDIRERAKISEVAQSHQLKLKISGSSVTCICPFHDDSRPSLTLDDDKNLFHCFSCGSGGDIFKFVGELEGVGFAEAVEILADRFQVPLVFDAPVHTTGNKDLKIKQVAMDEASCWFASKLLNPNAGGVRRYLRDRGLSATVVQSWRIGLSTAGVTQYLLSLNYSTVTLEAVGLLGTSQAGNIYEVFQNRLMIPVCNLQGKVVGFGGRQLGPADVKYPKYINSKETDLFEKRKLLFGADRAKSFARASKCCVVVEGYFDVLSLHASGITNVVGCMGTALSSEQLSSAHRLSNKGKVVLAMDGDEAGELATMRICETLLSTAEHLDVHVACMPSDCKDAHDVVTKHSSTVFQSLVDAARPWTEWYVHAVMRQVPGLDATSFARRVDKLSDVIAHLPSPHMKTFNAFKFAQILASHLGSMSASHERQLELDILAEASKKRKAQYHKSA